jgi:hypothetical protein
MSKAKALQQKLYPEQQRRCWQLLRNNIHGSKSSGGISHVVIPIPNDPNDNDAIQQYERIQTKNEMDTTLLKQNINHFKQADGTPFTRSPLLDIIGEDGCAEGALKILDDSIPEQTPKYATMLFKHMARVRPKLNINMNFMNMCQGFHRINTMESINCFLLQ